MLRSRTLWNLDVLIDGRLVFHCGNTPTSLRWCTALDEICEMNISVVCWSYGATWRRSQRHHRALHPTSAGRVDRRIRRDHHDTNLHGHLRLAFQQRLRCSVHKNGKGNGWNFVVNILCLELQTSTASRAWISNHTLYLFVDQWMAELTCEVNYIKAQ